MWEFIDGITMKQLAYNFMKEDFLPYSKLRNYQHSKAKKNKNDKLRIGTSFSFYLFLFLLS
jgi:hypothetical protein